MSKKFAGFSLIELLIVISIVSILSMVGIPSYEHYAQRARFTEVIAGTEPLKVAVAIALQSGVAVSELRNGAHGIPSESKSTKNVASIKVENGVITATATDIIAGTTYILKPNGDNSTWTIGGSCLKNGLCNA